MLYYHQAFTRTSMSLKAKSVRVTPPKSDSELSHSKMTEDAVIIVQQAPEKSDR